jgi:DNA repair protein RadC
MAAVNSARSRPLGMTPAPRTTQASPGPSRARQKARELVPCYRAGTGPTSFRHGLPDHERSVIDAALSILGRYLGEPGAALQSPQVVGEFMRLHLGAESHEVFAVLYLDNQHRAIAFELPFHGTLTEVSVYAREIARAALLHNAAAVVLAHNHPSGATRPSRADEELTDHLRQTLGVFKVRVLDHFIVTNQEAVSMAGLGLM